MMNETPINEDLCFDRELALSFTMGDETLLFDLIDIFFQDFPEKLHAMENAIQNEDLQLLSSLGHSIKGELHTLGFLQGKNIAWRIEKICDCDDWKVCLSLLSQLTASIELAKKKVSRETS